MAMPTKSYDIVAKISIYASNIAINKRNLKVRKHAAVEFIDYSAIWQHVAKEPEQQSEYPFLLFGNMLQKNLGNNLISISAIWQHVAKEPEQQSEYPFLLFGNMLQKNLSNNLIIYFCYLATCYFINHVQSLKYAKKL